MIFRVLRLSTGENLIVVFEDTSVDAKTIEIDERMHVVMSEINPRTAVRIDRVSRTNYLRLRVLQATRSKPFDRDRRSMFRSAVPVEKSPAGEQQTHQSS